MVAFDVFREDLTNLLSRCADQRRQRSSDCSDAGDDYWIAALFERLAADVHNLDLEVFLVCQTRLRHQRLVRTLTQQRDDVLERVGVTFSPADADELVYWMSWRSAESECARRAAPLQFIALKPAELSGADWPGCERGREPLELRSAQIDDARKFRFVARQGTSSGIVGSVASDFTVAFGIVAPMLSVWEVGRSVGQWRDQQLLQARAPVPATVIGSEPIGGDRSAGLARKIVLSFQPAPHSASCQIAVRVGFAPNPPEVGSTMTVVPRSDLCEGPLIASDVGSPGVTVMVAAALMFAGLFSIKLWDRIFRKGHVASLQPLRRTQSCWRAVQGSRG